MAKFLHWLSVIGVASFKMIPATALSILYDLKPWEIFVCLGLGGMLGITLTTLFGMQLRQWRKARRKRLGIKKPLNFRKARIWKRRWLRFGLPGIAFIVPAFLSPVLGAMIAVFFERSKTRIFVYMGACVLFWAGIFALLGQQILDLLHD